MKRENGHNEEKPNDKPPLIIEPRVEVTPLVVPESQGDAADRAQDQIDADLSEQIRRARTPGETKDPRESKYHDN